MRVLQVSICLFVLSVAVFAQSDRGTIADPAGAVVASAPIEARNGNGCGVTSRQLPTGNYTLAQLPTGNYEISVSVPGFKKYVQHHEQRKPHIPTSNLLLSMLDKLGIQADKHGDSTAKLEI